MKKEARFVSTAIPRSMPQRPAPARPCPPTKKTRPLARLGFLSAVLILSPWVQAQELQPAPPAVPPMQEISPGVYQMGKMRFDKKARSVSFPATVNMASGLVEYLLVSPHGATHESVLVTEVEPTDLHFVMLLLGAKGSGTTATEPKAGGPPQINSDYLKSAPQLKGDPVTLALKWTEAGKEKTARAEDWLRNTETGKPAARGPWTYTGSMFGGDRFLAQAEGCFAALLNYPSALINNPRKGNHNDQVWEINKKAIPPRDTPVEMTIQLQPEPTRLP